MFLNGELTLNDVIDGNEHPQKCAKLITCICMMCYDLIGWTTLLIKRNCQRHICRSKFHHYTYEFPSHRQVQYLILRRFENSNASYYLPSVGLVHQFCPRTLMSNNSLRKANICTNLMTGSKLHPNIEGPTCKLTHMKSVCYRHAYYEQPSHNPLFHLYIFIVVNCDALAQASDIRI